MSNSATRLLAEALHLSDKERADLAAKLLESLDPLDDGNIDQAWAEEIRHRLEEFQFGRVQSIPWTQAREMILEDIDDDAAP